MKILIHLNRITLQSERILATVPMQMQAALVLLAMVGGGFFFDWWIFLVPAVVAGFYSRLPLQARKPVRRVVTALGIVSWLGMAFAQDALTGWRLSPRLSGLVHIPWGVGIYLILASVIGFLTFLAVNLGQNLRFFLASQDR